MDFFEYTNLTQQISAMIPGGLLELWICMIVGGACFLAVYIFQSIGLYTIARREGFKHKWMAFLPFFNTYYIGVCGQKNRFFNIDTKKIALAAAIIEVVLFAIYTLYYVAFMLLDANNIFETFSKVGDGVEAATENIFLPDTFADDHPSLAWAGWCYNYLDIILGVLELVYLFVLVVVLNCFFQTYSAKHYFLFTLACIFFPIQGVMVFVVRNNKAMSYSEYVRRMQEQAYRQYRDQQNSYRNPYDGNPYNGNPYDGNPYGGNPDGSQNRQPPRPADDPFEEYQTKKDDGDPFDEFKN